MVVNWGNGRRSVAATALGARVAGVPDDDPVAPDNLFDNGPACSRPALLVC
jgi:hypothetical protein